MIVAPIDKGLFTYPEPYAVPVGACVEALNVSFARPGCAETRKGTVRANTTALSAAVLGLFQFAKEDGTIIRLAKIGTTLATLTLSGSDGLSVASTIKTGMASGFKPYFVPLGNAVLIFDKTENYIYDGTNITELGRDAPTGITAADGGGAGLLDDGAVYAYKFAFYATGLGIESTLSAAVTVDLTAGQTKVAVTLPVGVTSLLDSVWDKIRVYRTVGGGSSYLLHSSNQTASFTDNTADASLGAAAADTLYINLPPARTGAEHLGRAWAVIEAEPTNVYYSDAGQPHQWKSAQTLRIGQKDGDHVLGFLKSHGRFFALKKRSLWLLIGDDSSNFEWTRVEGAAGCGAARAALTYRGVSYVFQAEDEIYAFQGLDVQRIGDRIRTTVQAFKRTVAEDEFIAEVEPQTGAIWFAVHETTSSTVNDRVLVYFPRTDAWSLYTLRVSAMARFTRTAGETRLLLGDEDGFLSWAEEGRYDGGVGGTLKSLLTTGSTASSLELTTSGLFTTGGGLAALDVVVYDVSAGLLERVKVTSNDTNTITLASSLSFTPEVGVDIVYVGGINTKWVSGLLALDNPSKQTRIRAWHLLLHDLDTAEVVLARLRSNGATAGSFTAATVTDLFTKELPPVAAKGGMAPIRVQAEVQHVDVLYPLVLQGVAIDLEGVGQREDYR